MSPEKTTVVVLTSQKVWDEWIEVIKTSAIQQRDALRIWQGVRFDWPRAG